MREVGWRHGLIHLGPGRIEGKLFRQSEEGQTLVIATGEEFRLWHVNELDDVVEAIWRRHRQRWGDRLLIRTEQRLY